MRVKLIAHTDNPDKVVSMAAKLCYSPVGAESIGEGLSPQEVEKFLGILVSMGHESPIEHVSFTFSNKRNLAKLYTRSSNVFK